MPIAPAAPGFESTNDLLTPEISQLLADDTGHHIRTAARRIGHNEAHELVWITLGLRVRRCATYSDRKGANEPDNLTHAASFY
jgi:hypothetical protein